MVPLNRDVSKRSNLGWTAFRKELCQTGWPQQEIARLVAPNYDSRTRKAIQHGGPFRCLSV
jgi:hypothetical protein